MPFLPYPTLSPTSVSYFICLLIEIIMELLQLFPSGPHQNPAFLFPPNSSLATQNPLHLHCTTIILLFHNSKILNSGVIVLYASFCTNLSPKRSQAKNQAPPGSGPPTLPWTIYNATCYMGLFTPAFALIISKKRTHYHYSHLEHTKV